jgi:hypothetical protein
MRAFLKISYRADLFRRRPNESPSHRALRPFRVQRAGSRCCGGLVGVGSRNGRVRPSARLGHPRIPRFRNRDSMEPAELALPRVHRYRPVAIHISLDRESFFHACRTASIRRLFPYLLPRRTGLSREGRSCEAGLVSGDFGVFSQLAGNHPVLLRLGTRFIGSGIFRRVSMCLALT